MKLMTRMFWNDKNVRNAFSHFICIISSFKYVEVFFYHYILLISNEKRNKFLSSWIFFWIYMINLNVVKAWTKIYLNYTGKKMKLKFCNIILKWLLRFFIYKNGIFKINIKFNFYDAFLCVIIIENVKFFFKYKKAINEKRISKNKSKYFLTMIS